jgi:predicted alpha/beta-fold hydrolase
MEKIQIENIDIPIKSDNVSLKGSIYFTSQTPSKAPWIITLAAFGGHRNTKFIKAYNERFANAGYYVLSYDYRGHGETAKITGQLFSAKGYQTYPKIYSDINEIISWILEEQSKRLLDDKIALFGRSLGAAIILTHGFIDNRAKILIALAGRYDYEIHRIKFSPEIIEKISPKYFLKKELLNNERILIAHCQDDEIVPFENLLQVKEHLGLNDTNVIVYEDGGHSFRGHRDEIFEHSREFLKKL